MISFEPNIWYKIRTTCYWCSSWIFWVSLEDSQSLNIENWFPYYHLWHYDTIFCKHLVALLLVLGSSSRCPEETDPPSHLCCLSGTKNQLWPRICVFNGQAFPVTRSQKSSGNEKAGLLSCSSSQLLSDTGHQPLSKWPVYYMVMALVSVLREKIIFCQREPFPACLISNLQRTSQISCAWKEWGWEDCIVWPSRFT